MFSATSNIRLSHEYKDNKVKNIAIKIRITEFTFVNLKANKFLFLSVKAQRAFLHLMNKEGEVF